MVAGASRGVRWRTLPGGRRSRALPGGGRPWWSRRLIPIALSCFCLTGGLLLPPAATTAAAASAKAAKPVDRFAAISCPTAGMCIAVGTVGNYPKMLAEKWNGRGWSVMRLAQPSGAVEAGLTGVSCTSARACTAVGYDSGPNLGGTLAERWNGSKWRIQPTPSPGDSGIPFAAVSCGSATSCTAVGYYDYADPSFATSTLAEHWDGHSWSIQSLPPAGDGGDDLSSVSCRPVACTAVGYIIGQSDEGPGTAPLAMRWNGTTWAVQPTPGDPTQNEISALTGVSCPSARMCTAVGLNDNDGTLVLHWNGTTWRSQPVAGNYAFNFQLNAVSCPSTTACMAIGTGGEARWNGHKWTSQYIRKPKGANGFNLSAVSCSSATRCTAVGFKNMTVSQENDILTVAERWNGHTWTAQATRSP